MASLRDQIAEELKTRLETIEGLTANRVGGISQQTNVPLLGIVGIVSETKRPVDNLFYACTLQLAVLLQVFDEDAAEEEDAGNPYRYLDRKMAAVESVVHASEWPQQEIAVIEGHTAGQPDGSNIAQASLRLRVDYRHNFDDPTIYDPHF